MGREDATWITCRCSPYHTNSVLYPIIEHLQRALRWRPEEPAEPRLDKLEQALCTSRLPLPEAVPLLAALLSVPCAERYALPALTPQQQKQQTLDTLVAWLAAEAERRCWQCGTTCSWAAHDVGAPRTVRGPGTDGLDAARINVSADLCAAWPTRSHLTPLTLTVSAPPGRGPDYTSGGWKVAAGGGRAAHCGQDRWRAAVCRRQ